LAISRSLNRCQNSSSASGLSLEVADVFRAYVPAYLRAFGDVTSSEQRRVLRDLMRCRTAARGGHVAACGQCGHRVIAYNSCRNRHCPKCQAAARAQWLAKQAEDLLDVEYFHVVFTCLTLSAPSPGRTAGFSMARCQRLPARQRPHVPGNQGRVVKLGSACGTL
jgi:hypothetical protein